MFKRVRLCTPMYPLAKQRCTLGALQYHSLAYSLAAGTLPERGCSADRDPPGSASHSAWGTGTNHQASLFVGAGGLNSQVLKIIQQALLSTGP